MKYRLFIVLFLIWSQGSLQALKRQSISSSALNTLGSNIQAMAINHNENSCQVILTTNNDEQHKFTLTKEQIKSLIKKEPRTDVEDPDCAICYEKLYNNKVSVITLPCHSTHSFHHNCIHQWVAQAQGKTCPMCRKVHDLNTDTQGKNSLYRNDECCMPTPLEYCSRYPLYLLWSFLGICGILHILAALTKAQN